LGGTHGRCFCRTHSEVSLVVEEWHATCMLCSTMKLLDGTTVYYNVQLVVPAAALCGCWCRSTKLRLLTTFLDPRQLHLCLLGVVFGFQLACITCVACCERQTHAIGNLIWHVCSQWHSYKLQSYMHGHIHASWVCMGSLAGAARCQPEFSPAQAATAAGWGGQHKLHQLVRLHAVMACGTVTMTET
jgi:hypothetical protein